MLTDAGNSLLNIRCADWRDLHATWDQTKQVCPRMLTYADVCRRLLSMLTYADGCETKQKTFYAKCMAQDCEQSLEAGATTPGCRFMDGNKEGGEVFTLLALLV